MFSQDSLPRDFKLFRAPPSTKQSNGSTGLSTAFDKVNMGLAGASGRSAVHLQSYRDRPSMGPTQESLDPSNQEFGGFFTLHRAPSSQLPSQGTDIGGLEEDLHESLVMSTPQDLIQGQLPLSQLGGSQMVLGTPAEPVTQPAALRMDGDGFCIPEPPVKDYLGGKSRRIQGSQPSMFGSQPYSQAPSQLDPMATPVDSPSPTPHPKRPRSHASRPGATERGADGAPGTSGHGATGNGNGNGAHHARPAAPVRRPVSPPPVPNPFLEELRRREGGTASAPALDSAGQMDRLSRWVGQDGCSMQLGRQFQELGYLGQGSYGKVFMVRHRFDGALYAVKQAGGAIHNKAKLSEQLSEAQAMRAAGLHPCLVQYFGSWLEDKRVFIQMELCGASLASLIAPREDPLELMAGGDPGRPTLPLSEAILTRLHDDMVEALAHLHGRGLAHMDLKPENIYVGEGLQVDVASGVVSGSGRFKLGDFGKCVQLTFARGANGEEVCSAGFNFDTGDARYLSPELLESGARVDPRKADLFALGAALYELAKGSALPSEGEAYQKIRKGQIMVLPGCSAPFVREIRTLMDPEPSRRVPRLLGGLSSASHAHSTTPSPGVAMSPTVVTPPALPSAPPSRANPFVTGPFSSAANVKASQGPSHRAQAMGPPAGGQPIAKAAAAKAGGVGKARGPGQGGPTMPGPAAFEFSLNTTGGSLLDRLARA